MLYEVITLRAPQEIAKMSKRFLLPLLLPLLLVLLLPLSWPVGEAWGEPRAAVSSEKGLSRALERVLATVLALERHGGAGQSEQARLRQLRRELERLDGGVEAGFAAVAAQLQAQGAPGQLIERQAAALSRYQAGIG